MSSFNHILLWFSGNLPSHGFLVSDALLLFCSVSFISVSVFVPFVKVNEWIQVDNSTVTCDESSPSVAFDLTQVLLEAC